MQDDVRQILREYECVEEKTCEHMTIQNMQRVTNNGEIRRSCIAVRCTETTAENIDMYCTYHIKHMETIMKRHRTKPRFFLLYDVRDAPMPDMYGAALPFIRLHNDFREKYKSVLIGTVIIINNKTVQQIINGLFTTIYTPARPIRILTSLSELEKDWY
jgi:hypothetical protein